MDTIKTITLRLTPEFHKKVKMYALQNDRTIQDLIIELLEKKIEQ